ncbi:NADPH-dependent oxidoreductase [Pseudonocardiaceae bacterium YIM PH 21723]|nr:NADPH-dependent oxidoreductase [Pseudonocardiaceae bacterium YIM PH 21723]
MAITVVGIGGSVRADSQSERALDAALAGAEHSGATIYRFTGPDLLLPFYDPVCAERPPLARELVDRLRTADGVVLASPGYHGTVSGLVKNALDYIEDLREDERPYLHGRAVGCVATAMGWQAAVNTLTALRSIVHALRGWPTPLGVAVNTAEAGFDGPVLDNLHAVGRQVVDFAKGAP